VRQDLLGDLAPDAVHRVQRGHRVLEDHRDLLAADLAQIVLARADELGPAQLRRAGELGVGRLRQAEQRHRRHRLARAGLAHDGEHLALAQVERHLVDGVHDAVLGGEVDLETVDAQQRCGGAHERRILGSRNA
jgi:hypothetical protein